MKITESVKRRFLSKIKIEHRSKCWLWQGATDGHGYGILSSSRNKSPFKAHRVGWAIANNADPGDLVICHKCDNPRCVNPDHLFAGTQADNMRDCSAKGRLNAASADNLKVRQKKRLSSNDVAEIQKIKFASRNGRGGVTRKSVAESYGVCVDVIRAVEQGRY